MKRATLLLMLPMLGVAVGWGQDRGTTKTKVKVVLCSTLDQRTGDPPEREVIVSVDDFTGDTSISIGLVSLTESGRPPSLGVLISGTVVWSRKGGYAMAISQVSNGWRWLNYAPKVEVLIDRDLALTVDGAGIYHQENVGRGGYVSETYWFSVTEEFLRLFTSPAVRSDDIRIRVAGVDAVQPHRPLREHVAALVRYMTGGCSETPNQLRR